MSETRKLTTILAADVVGYSRLATVDEEGTVARLRALRHELVDPVVATNKGRLVKTTGDGRIVEFGSVVDAVRCAIEVQRKMAVRNADVASDKRIEFRVGIHLGDVIVESDGDLMGDGVNVAARLEGIAEPGGICVSEDAWRQVRDKITTEFLDLGDRQLKNIARPVKVYAISPPSGPDSTLAPKEQDRAAAENIGPPRLSIVVLPFANIGGDPEQEYFVDGVTESLTTDLSRISGSFVIARNTAFTYKGKPVDVKHIGGELNVRYVLEGSVQRSGNRMRVNVQLIDAETGTHLWAERFDKPVADLFDMQDEIVTRLARQLDVVLVATEARRAEGAANSDSLDWYFRGQAAIVAGETTENYALAFPAFERALALDVTNVDALAALSRITVTNAINFFVADMSSDLEKASALARRAIALAPNHARAHMSLAHVYQMSDRAADSLAEYQRALALDRNLTHAHAGFAVAKTYMGKAEDSEAHIADAFRLSPFDAEAHIWCYLAGVAKMHLCEYPAAETWFRRGIEINPALPMPFFYLAGVLAELGRDAEAGPSLNEGFARNPQFTMQRFQARRSSTNPIYVRQRERVAEILRKAGVPEV